VRRRVGGCLRVGGGCGRRQLGGRRCCRRRVGRRWCVGGRRTWGLRANRCRWVHAVAHGYGPPVPVRVGGRRVLNVPHADVAVRRGHEEGPVPGGLLPAITAPRLAGGNAPAVTGSAYDSLLGRGLARRQRFPPGRPVVTCCVCPVATVRSALADVGERVRVGHPLRVAFRGTEETNVSAQHCPPDGGPFLVDQRHDLHFRTCVRSCFPVCVKADCQRGRDRQAEEPPRCGRPGFRHPQISSGCADSSALERSCNVEGWGSCHPGVGHHLWPISRRQYNAPGWTPFAVLVHGALTSCPRSLLRWSVWHSLARVCRRCLSGSGTPISRREGSRPAGSAPAAPVPRRRMEFPVRR